MSQSIVPALDSLRNSFPNAQGNLNLDVPDWQQLLLTPGATFTPAQDQPVGFTLSTGEAKPATFAANGGVNLSLGGSASLNQTLALVWQNGPTNADLTSFITDGWLPADALAADNFYAAMNVTAQAALNGSGGAAPAPGVTASLGLSARGEVSFKRCKPYARTEPATAVLLDYFGTLRSPLSIPDTGDVVAAGEVLSFGYNGNVKLSASLGAGYNVSGIKGFTVGSLQPQFSYQIAAQATIGYAFTAGGAFQYILGPGSAPGWVRLQLTKQKSIGNTLNFGITVGGSYNLSGVPENATALIKTFLGLDPTTALSWLQTISGIGSLDQAKALLQQKFGVYANAQLAAVADPVFNVAFSSEAYTTFQSKVQALLAIPGDVQSRITGYLQKYDGDKAKILGILNQVTNLTPATLKDVSDNDVWTFITDEWGDDLVKLVTDTTAFTQLTAAAGKVRDVLNSDPGQMLTNYWTQIEQRTGLDKLAQILSTATDPTAVRALFDGKANALLNSAFNLTFNALVPGPAGEAAVKEAQAIALKILALRDKLNAALTTARSQKFEASLGAEFGSTSSASTLVDLEFNTAVDRSLLQQALGGDFAPALQLGDPTQVKVLGGKLQRVRTSTRSVSVAAFGWSSDSADKLTQTADANLQQTGDGMLWMLTTATTFDHTDTTKAKGQIEQVKSRFTLNSLATATPADQQAGNFLKPFLKEMSVGYVVDQSDTTTSWAELTSYLQFAQNMSLLPSPEGVAEFVEELQATYPNGIGSTDLNYSVTYASDALLTALQTLAPTVLTATATSAIRSYFSSRFLSTHTGDWAQAVIAAFLKSATIVQRGMSGPRAGPGNQKYTVVTFADGTFQRFDRGRGAQRLLVWSDEEEAFTTALTKLANAVKTGASANQLDALSADFANVAAGQPLFGTELWQDNVFFLAVDAIIQKQGAAAGRQAVLKFTFTPTGESTPVTKLLSTT